MNHLKSGNRKAKSGNVFTAETQRRGGAFGEMGGEGLRIGDWGLRGSGNSKFGNALRVTRNPILIAARIRELPQPQHAGAGRPQPGGFTAETQRRGGFLGSREIRKNLCDLGASAVKSGSTAETRRRGGFLGSLSPISYLLSPARLGLVAAAVLALSGAAQAQTTIVGWDFNGLSGYGASPQAPNTSDANVTAVGLTRSGLGTGGTAASNAWGGTGNGSASFTLKAKTGFTLSLSQISAYNVRRSNTGATTGQWAYSLDGSTFVDIGSAITWGSTTTSTGNAQTAITLSGISALQNLPATTTVTFRLTLTGGTTGTWYLNNFQTGNDFVVTGTIAPAAGSNPLLSLALSPNPVAESLGSSASTGTVTVSSAPASNLTVNLSSANTLAVTVPATVTILAGQTSATFPIGVLPNAASYDNQSSLITASADNHTSGTATMVVANADKRPMTVVVNKYINATPDKAELLVVGNGTPGGTLDMRGMIFKDFSSEMGGDGGAQYTFTTSALWAAVPVGTLIVLSNDGTAADTDSADFKLELGLGNTTYFTKSGGTFDISTTEMIMIKEAGSGTAGISGGIHALAAGTAGANYTDFVGYKLIASATTATDKGVYANNANGVLADFDGTGATGDVAKTDAALTFGAASTAGNAIFIASLRGVDPADGSGAVSLANSTGGSPYALSPIFAREATGQSVSLTLTGTVPDKTISEVTVLVPALLGAPLADNVTLTGTGAGSATKTVSGQTITVSGAAVTTTAPLTINISGLSTPALADLSSSLGNLPFTVSTAKAGGALTALGSSPSALVLIPIQTIRAVEEANGTPTHNGKVVAVEGVCTDIRTGSGAAPAYLQDGDYGVAIYSGTITKVFAPGTRYAVAGTVGEFNGLTQVNPMALIAIVEVGAGSLPTPRVITLPLSSANAELYEGTLVKIENLYKASSETNSWGAAKTIKAYAGSATNTNAPIDIRIQGNSTATTEPSYPVTITGILGQYDSSAPKDSFYQIMPRTASDLGFAGSPTLSLTSDLATLIEGSSEAAVTLRRSNVLTSDILDVAIGLSLANTLEADVDLNGSYEAFPSTVQIPAGQAQISFLVRSKNDAVANGNRSLVVTASASGFNSPTLDLTLQDDDTAVPPGSTFAGWSSNATVTSELVGKYGIGGATNLTGASEKPVSAVDSNTLSLSAIVRTNDTNLTVLGEAGGSLTNWSTNGVSVTASTNTNGVPEGHQRQVFSVDRTNSPTRQFLRLKATLAP